MSVEPPLDSPDSTADAAPLPWTLLQTRAEAD